MTTQDLTPFLAKIHLPEPNSHKGQNGKVMIIGGSQLFHAASQWALTVTSRIVDMVFYASTPSNNQIIQDDKKHFANGIVITRAEIEDYIQEADVILIGPGMERNTISNFQFSISNQKTLSEAEWNNDTEKITNYLLQKYQHKKWVVDAGALQMVDPLLLNDKMIITPHVGELERVLKKLGDKTEPFQPTDDSSLPASFPHTTVLLKGPVDYIYPSPTSSLQSPISLSGGNEGMTKGGTGDVLAGIVAGLYAWSDDPVETAVVASFINKQAGDSLYKTVGPFFNASDLADQIPKELAKIFHYLP